MDITSILLFIVGLALTVGLIFGVTAFALWLRTKIAWSPAGRLLVKLGRPLANGSVYHLRPGHRYAVIQGFTDYHGGRFEAGERLTFKSHNFVPYHGGHVLTFEERNVYLQEEENADVLGRIWAYIEPARR